MPPIATNENHDHEVVLLSDDDVEILHNIVQRAQEHIDTGARTFDSLFSAYETVFAENDLDTSQDRTIFRFLFRLGQPRGARHAIYEVFEDLLAEQNIVLEHPEGTSEIHSIRGDSSHVYAGEADREGRPSRRASFTSLYDTTKDLTRGDAPRAPSRSSVSRLETRVPRSLSVEAASGARQQRLSAYGLRSHEKRDHRQDQEAPACKNRRTLDNGANGDYVLRNRHRLAEPPRHQVPEQQLLELEHEFQERRLFALLRKYLIHWNSKLYAMQKRTIDNERKALAIDRKTMVRQVFDLWRASSERLRHEREKEQIYEHRCFHHLKRRDNYLLAKAFSHWQILSAEEVARTGVAQRHMLRRKYFNAWREITEKNELKVQRQGLRRPYNMLRQRYAEVCNDELAAIATYNRNLTKVIFFRWYWNYYNIAVPRYREAQFQKKLFLGWVDKAKQTSSQENQADAFLIERTMRKIVQRWATAARVDLGGYHQADSFRRSKLLTPFLETWRLETQLAPLATCVSNMRDWRIARTNFTAWKVRAVMARKAEEFHAMRLKQKSWTAWSDQLRVRAIQQRIQDRLVRECLYKWVIRTRYRLLKRERDDNIQRNVYKAFLQKVRAKMAVVRHGEENAMRERIGNLLSSTVHVWRLQLDLQDEREKMAMEYYTPRVKLEVLSGWRQRLQHDREHAQSLERRTDLAIYWFSTSKFLTKWKNAAQEAQKKRRQAAYSVVRKRVKMNLANRALQAWQGRIEGLPLLQQNAQTFADGHVRGHLASIVTIWRSRAREREEREQVAVDIHNTHTIKAVLVTWQTAAQKHQNIQSQASTFHRIHMLQLCGSLLPKLSLRGFQIRRREDDADATRERNFDKHLRRMFKHWNDRTRTKMLERLADADPELLKSPSHSRTQEPYGPGPAAINMTELEYDTRRAEEWTAFDDILDVGDTTTDWIPALDTEAPLTMSTPGYLNTPSKRAVRARALANMSTTPAGMPGMIRTPFTARLRGERGGAGTPATERERERGFRKVTFDEELRGGS